MSDLLGEADEATGFLDTISGVEARENPDKFKRWMELALEASDAGVWEWDIQTDLIYWDERTETTFGYEPGRSPITYADYAEHLPDDDLQRLENAIAKTLEDDEPYDVTFRIRTTDEELRWLRARGSVVYENGEPSRMIGVQTDVTEKKRANRALGVIRRCREVIIRAGDEEELLNDVCEELVKPLGYEFAWIGTAKAKPEKLIEPLAASDFSHEYLKGLEVRWDETARAEGASGRAVRTGQPQTTQRIEDDERYDPWRDELARHGFKSSVAVPFTMGEEQTGLLNLYASDPYAFDDAELDWLDQLADDITRRIRGLRTKRQLQEAALSLEEKETLLREIHHRVKNNMQIISSIINLHKNQDSGKSNDRVMQECQNRIQSMAMVHDMLYQSNNLAELSFDEYVEQLVGSILNFNNIPGDSVDVTINVPSYLDISLSQAVPCGLIINELVTNACEHAFERTRENELIVEFKETPEGYELRVRDNGPGLPDDLDLDSVDSVGLDIVRALSNYELQGDLRISSEPMTTVELSFQLGDSRI